MVADTLWDTGVTFSYSQSVFCLPVLVHRLPLDVGIVCKALRGAEVLSCSREKFLCCHIIQAMHHNVHTNPVSDKLHYISCHLPIWQFQLFWVLLDVPVSLCFHLLSFSRDMWTCQALLGQNNLRLWAQLNIYTFVLRCFCQISICRYNCLSFQHVDCMVAKVEMRHEIPQNFCRTYVTVSSHFLASSYRVWC